MSERTLRGETLESMIARETATIAADALAEAPSFKMPPEHELPNGRKGCECLARLTVCGNPVWAFIEAEGHHPDCEKVIDRLADYPSLDGRVVVARLLGVRLP